MSLLAIDFLDKFSDKDIERTYFEEFSYYIRKTVCEGECSCDKLISFYQAVFTSNEKMADRMLDTFVDSYDFCAAGFVYKGLSEECAEKIFNIKFRDELINLFGRAAIEMINAKNPTIRSKAFDIVKEIGNKEDIPEPFELIGNGVDETASAWHTGRFCRLCYAEALIEGDFDEHDPIKGLSVLSEEFATDEFYDDTIGICLQDYLKYKQNAYEQFIQQKNYDAAYEVVELIPTWLYCEDKENYKDFIEEQRNLISNFTDLLNKENIDMAKYDWSDLDWLFI